MKDLSVDRFIRMIVTVIFIFIAAGCTGNVPVSATQPPVKSPTALAAATPTVESVAQSTATATADDMASMDSMASATPATTAVVPVSGSASAENILYQDNFTDPSTGWPEDKFDNYFVGYHEPEYYHIEVTSPNYKTTVFEPKKMKFDDFTVELKVLANSTKTAPTGDFRYGLAFRRSGDQYYAFTISPRTKKWYVLKNSPNALTVLKEGTDQSIHDLDTDDTLRVDAQGSSFSFHINDHLVDQLTDPDYANGEIGFYVESFDAQNAHIHFDDLVVRKYEAPVENQQGILFHDDFTNPASGWPDKKFDNYFIGYHEPEYYHVEVTSPNYRTTVFAPQKQKYDDATIELKVLTAPSKTSPSGDFRYGLAFRRSGDQYYAFTISPRTKKWYVLKSSPSALAVLKEGTDQDIHDLGTDDTLRVDMQGADMVFHINDKLVGEVTDSDYASGEVGFYVESFDAQNTHVHFDDLTVRKFEVTVVCNVNALSLNVRSGPGTGFPSSTFLTNGNSIEPIGRSEDGQWIKIQTDTQGNQGWVFYSSQYLSCTPDTKLLPVITQ